MIRTDNSIGRERYDLHEAEPAKVKAEALAALQTEEAALAKDKRALGLPSGPPARIGEHGAGTDMLKAQLLRATAVPSQDSLIRDGLSNGQSTTLYPSGGNNGARHTIYINGINTSSDTAVGEGQKLANTTNVPIDAIYQHSSIGNVALREAALLAARIAILGPFG